jgi:Zn-dependent M28 family amino/carboxypeptidase
MPRRSSRTPSRTRSRRLAATASAAGLLAAALVPLALQPAEAAKPKPAKPAKSVSCDRQNNNTYQKLLACIGAESVMKHERAFQAIADANEDQYYPGSRAAGTEGYDESVDYVAGLLRKAGWKVTLDPTDVTYYIPAELREVTPNPRDIETGIFTASGFGTVEGNVIPVDVNLTGDRASSSGCQASDFAGLDFSGANDIALIQRGTCGFANKAQNADDAGAEAVIIFNQGNAPDRQELIVGTAANLDPVTPGVDPQRTGPSDISIPVVGASFADGADLASTPSTAFVKVTEPEIREDFNVLAEKPGRNKNNVVMAGAHLDSVEEGPGINDNGSGSAALLDLALKLSKVDNRNTLRFGWWAAEEQGLVGSADYVAGLPQAEKDRIAAYLNFDMIGSPNFINGVYDADESSFPAPAGVTIPEGSEALEDLFEIFFTWKNIPYEDSEFSGRSDYQAFIQNGIPASGLFTGAEVLKTEEQEAIWGGVAGAAFDPCYHQACDSLTDTEGQDPAVYAELARENRLSGNVSLKALDQNSDAVAYAVLTLAYSTQKVNGVKGEAVPGSKSLRIPTTPAGPEGTFAGGGGGLDHDHDHEGPAA